MSTRERLAADPHRMVAGSRQGVACSCGWFGPGSEHEAHALDRLAALVERIADERAAEALRTVARRALRSTPGTAPVQVPVGALYEAADVLRVVTEPADGAQ